MTDKFDPKSKISNMQGRDYLEVKWRIVWFRSEHPKGAILTEVVGDDLMKATIKDADGNVIATGHGSSKKQGVAKSRPFEGAETAAIGRALAHAGYGTQFTDEDEAEHLADSPVERRNGNGDMTDADKRQYIIDRYSALFERAKQVHISIPALDAKLTIDQMKALYYEQKKFLEDAEEQERVVA